MTFHDEAKEAGQPFVTGKPGALQHLFELSPDSSRLRFQNRHWSEHTAGFQRSATLSTFLVESLITGGISGCVGVKGWDRR
jgi:hypothetical protein